MAGKIRRTESGCPARNSASDTVIRPGDANETAVAWRVALEIRDRPVVLVLTRQALPTLDRSCHASADGLRRGAYILSDAPKPNHT